MLNKIVRNKIYRLRTYNISLRGNKYQYLVETTLSYSGLPDSRSSNEYGGGGILGLSVLRILLLDEADGLLGSDEDGEVLDSPLLFISFSRCGPGGNSTISINSLLLTEESG